MDTFFYKGEEFVSTSDVCACGHNPDSLRALMSTKKIFRIKADKATDQLGPNASLMRLCDARWLAEEYPHYFKRAPRPKRKRARVPSPTDLRLEKFPADADFSTACSEWGVAIDDRIIIPAGTCGKPFEQRHNNLLVYKLNGEECESPVCDCQLPAIGMTPSTITRYTIDGVQCVKRNDLEVFSTKSRDALVGKLNRSDIPKFSRDVDSHVYLPLKDVADFAKANADYFKPEFLAAVEPTNIDSEPLTAAQMAGLPMLCKHWAVPGIAPAGTCGKPFDQRQNFTIMYTLGGVDCMTMACECQLKHWGLAVPEKEEKEFVCIMEIDASYVPGYEFPNRIAQARVTPNKDGTFTGKYKGKRITFPPCAVFSPRAAPDWDKEETNPILRHVEVGSPITRAFAYNWEIGVIVGNDKEKREFTIAFENTDEKGTAKQKRVSYDLVRTVTPNRKMKK